MDYLLICIVSLLASGLTLFSGFGLGTLLLPAFALFFSLPVAIAATAVVHLANNLFKLALLGRHADRHAVVRFALPAAGAAILGGLLLRYCARLPVLWSYEWLGSHQVTGLKLVIGLLIVVFACCDLLPAFKHLAFDRKYLPLGGMLSGFFGGLSGHQGALRSAFLVKAGLSKEAFIATGVVCAVLVDFARLGVYGLTFYSAKLGLQDATVVGPAIAACLSAFSGAYLGRRLLHKVTYETVQWLVGIMLIGIGLGMAAGLI